MPRLPRLIPTLTDLGSRGATANARAELDAAVEANVRIDALLVRLGTTTAPASQPRRAA